MDNKYINLETQAEVDSMIGQTCKCGGKIFKSKFNTNAYCGTCKQIWAVSKFQKPKDTRNDVIGKEICRQTEILEDVLKILKNIEANYISKEIPKE